jgi:glycosyltransferase involved in cell wall biosynthesis
MVLVEALACGCPVISTDCESGPREILEGGRFGTLVPVGDSDALAEAIEGLQEATWDPADLKQRAEDFRVETVAQKYLAIMESAISKPDGQNRP